MVCKARRPADFLHSGELSALGMRFLSWIVRSRSLMQCRSSSRVCMGAATRGCLECSTSPLYVWLNQGLRVLEVQGSRVQGRDSCPPACTGQASLKVCVPRCFGACEPCHCHSSFLRSFLFFFFRLHVIAFNCRALSGRVTLVILKGRQEVQAASVRKNIKITVRCCQAGTLLCTCACWASHKVEHGRQQELLATSRALTTRVLCATLQMQESLVLTFRCCQACTILCACA